MRGKLNTVSGYRKADPCPLCGGYGGAYREENRCKGFYGERQGEFSCTRIEEGSYRTASLSWGPPLYWHRLKDKDTSPVAPPPPAGDLLSSPKAYSSSAMTTPSERAIVTGDKTKDASPKGKKRRPAGGWTAKDWPEQGEISIVKDSLGGFMHTFCRVCSSHFCPHAAPQLWREK